MQIGTFVKTTQGYVGRLQTMMLDVPLRLVSLIANDGENAPHWRVFVGEEDTDPDMAIEVGAGWNREGASAGAYIAVLIDCPSLARPLRANLLADRENQGQHVLLWSSRQRRNRAQ